MMMQLTYKYQNLGFDYEIKSFNLTISLATVRSDYGFPFPVRTSTIEVIFSYKNHFNKKIWRLQSMDKRHS